MTPEAEDRPPARTEGGTRQPGQEPSLPERLLQALGGRGAENPGQILMNRLRPSRILEKAADEELRPMGFGLYGAIAVDFIARQPHPPRLADISRFLMQEPQSLTALIQRLERRGWIRREPSQRDRRAVLLELTEAGRQLHQRLVSVLEGLLQDSEGEHSPG
jgi:DNA-binding MarR family transcriptional regulator